MKRHLLPLLLLAGVACLPAHRALAQDKPVLNTAPPSPPPPTPRAPAPASAPAPAPTAQPAASDPNAVPAPQPTPDRPSGLNFPGRTGPGTGSKEDQPQKKKFLYTNFGLGLSSSGELTQFNVSAAPAVGFRLTEKLAVGPGISYAYSSFSLPDNSRYVLTASGGKSISTSSIGVKAFAQYIVYNEFFVHAEYEVTNAQLVGQDASGYFSKTSRTVSTPLAGVGYRQSVGENAALDIVGLYNFGNTFNSLYPPLVLRFSFLFNFGR